jgi:hypothetical protein
MLPASYPDADDNYLLFQLGLRPTLSHAYYVSAHACCRLQASGPERRSKAFIEGSRVSRAGPPVRIQARVTIPSAPCLYVRHRSSNPRTPPASASKAAPAEAAPKPAVRAARHRSHP